MDELRPAVVDFSAQKADVGLDVRAVTLEVVVPHMVEDLTPGQHSLGVQQQVPEQLVLSRRQFDTAIPTSDQVSVLVHLEIVVYEHARSLPRPPPKQQSASSHEFFH